MPRGLPAVRAGGRGGLADVLLGDAEVIGGPISRGTACVGRAEAVRTLAVAEMMVQRTPSLKWVVGNRPEEAYFRTGQSTTVSFLIKRAQ